MTKKENSLMHSIYDVAEKAETPIFSTICRWYILQPKVRTSVHKLLMKLVTDGLVIKDNKNQYWISDKGIKAMEEYNKSLTKAE